MRRLAVVVGWVVLSAAAHGDGLPAEVLAKARKAGTLSLVLWFRVAEPAAGPACATVHSTGGKGVRLAVEPLAFELWNGKDKVASGETNAFAALRERTQAPAAGPPR